MDRFQVIKTYGSGSSGEALLVVERSTNTEYVIKRMSMEGASKEEKARAAREASTLQMLNHPNIVRFHSSFFHGEFFCIVMEKCVCSLDDLIQRCHEVPGGKGGFPQPLLIEWMTELLAALCFLQASNVIHRDIKASNIFVTKKNHLKIGDFGVCKVGSSSSVADSLGAGSVVGTPFYLPPEMCDGEVTADHKGDVWSLGVLFYELCMLEHPFTGGNILAVVLEITSKEIKSLPPHFDARFSKIIRWMLKKEPSARPTAQSVLDRYVFLPPSHPSHPQHDPDSGRAIQERHGPKLVLDAGGSPTTAAPSSAKSKAQQQQQHQQEAPRPPAAMVEEDDDEETEPLKPAPDAFLSDENMSASSSSLDVAKSSSGSNSNNSGNVLRPKPDNSSTSVQQIKKTSKPDAVLIASTDSSKGSTLPQPLEEQPALSPSPVKNKKTEVSTGSVIAKTLKAMLEDRRAELTDADLDDISVVVSEFRASLSQQQK